MANHPTTLVCPEWCDGGPHGAPPCHTRAIETIVLNDGVIRVSLSLQEPIDKGPKVQVVFHAHGDDYNSVYAASIGDYDAAILASAVAAAESLEGRDAATQVFLGSQGGTIAHALSVAATEAGVHIPRKFVGRGSGRPNPPPTIRERIADLWKATVR